jgi:hypothetical protein
MIDNEQMDRLFKYMEDRKITNNQASLGLMMIMNGQGINSLRGPLFNDFIMQEDELAQRAKRLSFFRPDDHEFLSKIIDAVGCGEYETILAVGTSRSFIEVIANELRESDLALEKEFRNRDTFWFRKPGSVFKVDLTLLNETRARDSTMGRGRRVDKLILHDAVSWRVYEQLIPCLRH